MTYLDTKIIQADTETAPDRDDSGQDDDNQ